MLTNGDDDVGDAMPHGIERMARECACDEANKAPAKPNHDHTIKHKVI